MSAIHKIIISLLIAVALAFFVIACWTPFASIDDLSKEATEVDPPVLLSDLTISLLGSASAITLGGFLSMSISSALIVCALLALVFFASDKTRKLSVACTALFIVFALFSLLLLSAGFNWFDSSVENPYIFYSPSTGFVFMLLAIIVAVAALLYFAIYSILKQVFENRSKSPYEELFELKKLLDQHVISQREFDAKKTEILTGKKMSREEREQAEKLSALERLQKDDIISQEEFEQETKEF